MKFKRTQSLIILSIGIIIFIIFGFQYLSFTSSVVVLVLLLTFLTYLFSTFFSISEEMLIKYSFFIKTIEIDVNNIKYIEAITVKKAGQIHITIKTDKEDFYYLYLKDNSKIQIDNYYRHSGKSLGRY